MRAWKRLGIGLLTTTLLTGGGLASAQKAQEKAPDPYQNLGLSAAQRTKLDAIDSERKTALTAAQQKIVGIQQKLMGRAVDKKASDQEIDKISDELAAASRETLKTEMKFLKAKRQILTQEQLTTMSKGGSK